MSRDKQRPLQAAKSCCIQRPQLVPCLTISFENKVAFNEIGIMMYAFRMKDGPLTM
jgi:hypothetical protein